MAFLGTVAFLALVMASVAAPLAGKLPAWGSLILANVAIHFVVFMDPSVVLAFHYDQADLHAHSPLALLRAVTAMYLHAGFLHLLGNMLILGFVGYHLEERLHPLGLLACYLGTGLVGTATAAVLHWGQPYGALGASGAIFGILGVLGAAFPNDRVLMPISLGLFTIFRRVRGWIAAAIGGGVQMLFWFMVNTGGIASTTGFDAHLGGLAAGILLGFFLYSRRPTTRQQDLAAFATNKDALVALKHIQGSQDEVEVREVWTQRLVELGSCPDCGGRLTQGRRGVHCSACGRR